MRPQLDDVDDLSEAIDVAKEIDRKPWRWGSRITYVVERHGKFWQFTAEFHSEEGLQGLYDGPTEVKQVERLVKEWVPA